VIEQGFVVSAMDSNGTLLRVERDAVGDYVVYRKTSSEQQFSRIATLKPAVLQASPLVVSGAGARVFMTTDNTGSWVVYLGQNLIRSLDNGLTWSAVSLRTDSPDPFSVLDLKWASNGTLMAVIRTNTSSTTRSVYRSVDKGVSWKAVNLGQGNPVSVVHTTGTTWVTIHNGVTTTRISTDDGITWSEGDTLGFTPDNFSQIMHSNGRFYAVTGTTLRTGTTLTNLTTSLATDVRAFTVDTSGNCLALVTSGDYKYSSNGAGFTNVNQKTISRFTFNASLRLTFGGGNWVDNWGSFITTADLLTHKSWYATSTSVDGQHFETSNTGRSIIALNTQCYLMSDDNCSTFEVRKFNVPTNGVEARTFISGCATDNNGNWVISLHTGSNTARFFVSQDNGLTWVLRSQALTGGARKVKGGNLPGRFVVQGQDTVTLTNDSFNNILAATATAGIGSQNIIYHEGFFHMLTWTGSEAQLVTVNETTGAVTQTVTQTVVSSSPSENYMVHHKNYTVLNGFPISFSPVNSETIIGSVLSPVSRNFGFDTDGKVVQSTGAPTGSPMYRLGSGVWVNFNMSSAGVTFYREGLASVTLAPNEYMKVS
jgi:hypothetical protein